MTSNERTGARLRSQGRAPCSTGEFGRNSTDDSLGGRLFILDLSEGWRRGAGRQLGLTGIEFRILAALMRSRGQLVTYEQFAEAVWVVTTGPESNSLEVHVSRIPQKLDAGGERRRIQTVRGIGYRFVAESKEDVPIS